MAIINKAKREINAKIVYFGNEGAGKSRAMQYAYGRIKPSLRGDFSRVAAGGAELLFFGFMPLDRPLKNGYRLCLHIYTMHGTSVSQAAWRMTLKGADGIVLMADASRDIALLEKSMLQLKDILGGYGMSVDEIPVVLQLDRSDAAGGSFDVSEAERLCLTRGGSGIPRILSDLSSGEGVLDSLITLSKMVIQKIAVRDDLSLPEEISYPGEDEAAGPDIFQKSLEPSALPDSLSASRLPMSDGDAGISVISEDIRQSGDSVEIPFEVSAGGEKRRLLITVAAKFE